eukprot:1956505-Amphidinium_carterae.1
MELPEEDARHHEEGKCPLSGEHTRAPSRKAIGTLPRALVGGAPPPVKGGAVIFTSKLRSGAVMFLAEPTALDPRVTRKMGRAGTPRTRKRAVCVRSYTIARLSSAD